MGKFISPSGSALTLICFFLPWMEVSCVGQTKYISGADKGGDIWVVFAAAAIALGAFLYFYKIKKLSQAKPIIILASIVAIAFISYKCFQLSAGIDTGFGRIKPSDLGFKSQIQVGGFGTIIGLTMSLIGSFRLRDESYSPEYFANKT
jgi:hypothetical protein